MRKRNIESPADVLDESEWAEIIKATKDFVGAELEDVVKAAKLLAFTSRESHVPQFDEMIKVIKETRTMATLDKENIDAIRQFCTERARPVSSSIAANVQKSEQGGKSGKRSSRGLSWD
jgi:SpoVK/Ycf46/Vps4 family AAA+-type ATPase